MSQTLFITDKEELVRIYTMNLKMYVGSDLIAKENALKGIELLDIHPGINLIIAQASIKKERTALDIQKYLEAKEREIPLIIMGDEPAIPTDEAVHLPENADLKTVVKSAANLLGVTAQDMMNQIVSEYVPVPLDNFYHIDESICDAYLRLKKSKNEYQYIKRVHANESIDHNDLDRYKRDKVESLFISSDYRLQWTNAFTEKIIGKMQNQNLSPQERSEVTDVAMKSVSEQMLSLGVTEQTVTFSQQTMASILKQVDDAPKLSKLLKMVLNDKLGYHYQHCQIITFLCTHIINNIEWGSREQAEKLAFVAFFHDIVLVDERLAKVRSEDEMKEFTFEEQEMVRNHPKNAIILLEKYPHMPLGADIIIKQHHGHKMGHGFPERFSNDLSPLSIVFIVAQDAADYIMENLPKKTVNIPAFVEKLQEKYLLPKFQRAIATLKDLSL